MAAMSRRVKNRGLEIARNVALFRSTVQAEGLRERVEVLEQEIQECRQLNLRLAELTDVVQELLLPLSQRDQQAVSAVLEKYSRGL